MTGKKRTLEERKNLEALLKTRVPSTKKGEPFKFSTPGMNNSGKDGVICFCSHICRQDNLRRHLAETHRIAVDMGDKTRLEKHMLKPGDALPCKPERMRLWMWKLQSNGIKLDFLVELKLKKPETEILAQSNNEAKPR